MVVEVVVVVLLNVFVDGLYVQIFARVVKVVEVVVGMGKGC